MTQQAEEQLSQHFRELVQRVLPAAASSPLWTEPLFVGEDCIDWEAKTVPESSLNTLAEFVPQFAALLDRKPTWIKLSAEGIWKQALVVIVSASSTRIAGIGVCSILLSGLPNIVARDSSWDIQRSFAIVR